MTAIDSKVWARLPPDQYIFFFRKIYAGEKGYKQELVAKFFAALYEECLRQGLKGEWNLQNYAVINDLMANLNFNAYRRRTPNSPANVRKRPILLQMTPSQLMELAINFAPHPHQKNQNQNRRN